MNAIELFTKAKYDDIHFMVHKNPFVVDYVYMLYFLFEK